MTYSGEEKKGSPMIKSMQRCQNCRFFKRTWEKVEKIAGVTYYLDRRELTRSEVHSIAREKEYRGCALDRTGMAILPEKLYELQRPVRWGGIRATRAWRLPTIPTANRYTNSSYGRPMVS